METEKTSLGIRFDHMPIYVLPANHDGPPAYKSLLKYEPDFCAKTLNRSRIKVMNKSIFSATKIGATLQPIWIHEYLLDQFLHELAIGNNLGTAQLFPAHRV